MKRIARAVDVDVYLGSGNNPDLFIFGGAAQNAVEERMHNVNGKWITILWSSASYQRTYGLNKCYHMTPFLVLH